MFSIENREDTFLLKWAERAPPEGVDDVVLNERIEPVEGAHKSRGISSTDSAAVRLRSSAVSSSLRMVRR